MMKKYPIHDLSEGPNHGQIIPGAFTHNPIPEERTATINFGGLEIKVEVDMNFHTNPNIAVFKILSVND